MPGHADRLDAERCRSFDSPAAAVARTLRRRRGGTGGASKGFFGWRAVQLASRSAHNVRRYGQFIIMVDLRSAHPPVVAELARWTLTDAVELQALRTSVRQVLQTQSVLAGPTLDDVAERMTIVVTELATNALRHAGPPSVVTMSRTRTALVLNVADDYPSAKPEIAVRRSAGAGGHGLRLTADLARDCGWYLDEDTKHVWALFDIPQRRRVSQAPRIAIAGLATVMRRLCRLRH